VVTAGLVCLSVLLSGRVQAQGVADFEVLWIRVIAPSAVRVPGGGI